MLNIVLFEPEMPANTGNIGRTCVITNTALHLIEPLGFQITDKMLKRSGLDYWPRLDVTSYADIYDFYIRNGFKEDYDPAIVSSVSAYVDEDIKQKISANEIGDGIENAKKGDTESKVAARTPRVFYATTKAKYRYTDVEFHDGDFIMFGKESAGIPEEILVQHPEECIRIPMMPEERSLNLANSVAIVLYEALRQLNFPGLEAEGELHRLHW